ncbi:MAG: hypothetical protein ACREL5_04180 [Gemmatimonadales bacterium]
MDPAVEFGRKIITQPAQETAMTSIHGATGAALLVGALLAAVSCAPPDNLTSHLIVAHQVQPDCMAGFCLPDPYPDSAGVWIASTITADRCTDGETYQDTDEDGLADLCEQSLADAFNPWLRYCNCDVAWGGEPTYAVKPVWRGSSLIVRIMYMPSYYDDAGADGDEWCDVADVLFFGACSSHSGHWGDSEAIVLDVVYNETTGHWLLHTPTLSQHNDYTVYYGNTGDGVSQFCLYYQGGCYQVLDQMADMDSVVAGESITAGSYPTVITYSHGGKIGGAPDIWVSPNKHANYATESDCNSGGGFLGFEHDDCSSNDQWTQMGLYDLYAGARNVGSSSVHLMHSDTLPARHEPYASMGYTESYWSSDKFGGWVGISSPTSAGYKYRLIPWHF